MKKRKLVTGIAAFIFIAAAAGAACVWWQTRPAPVQPDINDLLSVPRTAMQLRLFSGELDSQGKRIMPATRSEDYYDLPALAHLKQSRRRNADGSMSVDYFRADSDYQPTKLLTLVWGPLKQGESAPHLRQKSLFDKDGITEISDVVYDDTTGLRVKSGLRMSDGNYVSRFYFADGDSIDTEKIAGSMYPLEGDVTVTSIKRYHPDKTLSLSSVLNADNSRTVIESGSDGKPLRITHTGTMQYMPTVGEEVTIFYPGTQKIRVHSTTDSSGTRADFMRADGTVQCRRVISVPGYGGSGYTSLTETCFDAAGKTALIERDFSLVSQSSDTVNGIEVDKSTWHLTQIVEKGAAGKDARLITLNNDGNVAQVIRYNVTANGVKYAWAAYDYSPAGAVSKVSYHKSADPNGQADKIEQPAAKPDGIMSTIPPAELAPLDASDNLPLPSSYYGYGGYG